MIYNISTVFSHFSLLCNTKCDTDSRMDRIGGNFFPHPVHK